MSHAHCFRARLLRVKTAIDSNLEILALANIADAIKPEQLNRMLDCVALWIEHTGFQCDIDFCFHLVSSPANGRPAGLQTFEGLIRNGQYYAKTLRLA